MLLEKPQTFIRDKMIEESVHNSLPSCLLVLFDEVCTIFKYGRREGVITPSSSTISFKMSAR